MYYEEAISFLEDTKKYGSRLGLDTIRSLMHELGDPQERLPVIHIAGTNGKGSVGAMLSAVLTASGYKTGWFNSPEVFSIEEEFQIDGEPIGKERFAQILSKVRAACERVTAEQDKPHPTSFEVETAAAFLCFYEEECDIAVIEVGMGGATDATNVIERPLASVLTSIGHDHMHTLGKTLPEIAAAKAGIIKTGCPVISAPQDPAVMQVIRARCDKAHAPLYVADAATSIPLGLSGPFQETNAAVALKTLGVIQKDFPKITDGTIRAGMEEVRWPGRYERIASGPEIILDGAHNEDAAMRLREALDKDYKGKRIFYLMGVLADKDLDAITDAMFAGGERVFAVTPLNERALPAEELAKHLAEKKVDAVACENAHDAVSSVLKEAEASDVIVAFGSLFCLGEIREALRKETGIYENRKP